MSGSKMSASKMSVPKNCQKHCKYAPMDDFLHPSKKARDEFFSNAADDSSLASLSDPVLHQLCMFDKYLNEIPDKRSRLYPCQRKFTMKAEDEISVDSIISGLLAFVEPIDDEMKRLEWNIPTKEYVNEKEALIFSEKLYISRLRNTNCKLKEEVKIFLEHELQRIGQFHFEVEESTDGYIVFSDSEMLKSEENDATCGHSLKGKYDNKFVLIAEKREEFDYIDNRRCVKTLNAHNKDDVELIVTRENKINKDAQRFKTAIYIKGREDLFLFDGGILLLMRYLIVNKFSGCYKYYTMNLQGRILHCTLKVEKERKKVRIFKKPFLNVIRIINCRYFNDEKQESSETFYTPQGQMILHYWHTYKYILHAVKAPVKPQLLESPKLELMWTSHDPFFDQYRMKTKLTYKAAMEYLTSTPAIGDYLHDYMEALFKFRPENILVFTIRYFQNQLEEHEKYRKQLAAEKKQLATS